MLRQAVNGHLQALVRAGEIAGAGTMRARHYRLVPLRETRRSYACGEFAVPEEYSFVKTVVPVRLAQHGGEKLVSRSQAKRLVAGFERFRHVVLGFEGVAEIGQAFADKVFRVFASAHPAVEIVPVNMTAAVRQMVSRALSREMRSAPTGGNDKTQDS